MLGLRLVGAPRPVTREAIAAAVGERGGVLAPAYVELMSTWGPGLLCGVVELVDPASVRFRALQGRLRIDGAARRAAGAWGTLTDEQLAAGLVLGVDRRGFAYFARDAKHVEILHPSGRVLGLGSFEQLVRDHLIGNSIIGTQPMIMERYAFAHVWTFAERYRDDHVLGVPPLYVTDAPSLRDALIAAWTAGDEAAADAALAQVLEREVACWAMLDLLHYLSSPAASAIPSEIRATFADQLYRTVSRRLPEIVPELPIREIRIALGRGELAPAQLASITALVEQPAGIFAGALDDTEVALLAQLADGPVDEAARQVYADHLEERGATELAAALRSDDATAPPLADAAKRGLIAPGYLAPVDGAGRIRARCEAWAREAPAVSMQTIVDHIDALHPTARQGYEVLLELQARRDSFWQAGNETDAPLDHLTREMADAWPQLAIALRDPAARSWALGILTRANTREAAPYVLSCLCDRSADATREWLADLADTYVGFGKVKKPIAEAWIAFLDDPLLRGVAFRLCGDLGSDPRVFEAALAQFCDMHPHSEKILRKRKTEPRVREVLAAQLAAEEKTSLRGGTTIAYSNELGILARYLAKLGDPHAKELADRYKKYRRWRDYTPREDM